MWKMGARECIEVGLTKEDKGGKDKG